MNPLKFSRSLFSVSVLCALAFSLHHSSLYADGEDGVIRTKIDFVHGYPVVVKDDTPVQKEPAKTQTASQMTSGDIVTPTGRIIPRNSQITVSTPVSVVEPEKSVSADVPAKTESALAVVSPVATGTSPVSAEKDEYKDPIIITPDTAPIERGRGPLILMEKTDAAIPDPVLVSPSSNPVRTSKPQAGPVILVEKEEGYMDPVIVSPETTRKTAQTSKPVSGPEIITFDSGSQGKIADPVIVSPEKTRQEKLNSTQTVGPRIIMSNDRATGSSGTQKSTYSNPVIISPDMSSSDNGSGPYIYNP